MSENPTNREVSSVPRLDDYSSVIGEAEINELRQLARRLGPVQVKMVNSTAVGGGVAEILNRLVPLANEAGVATRWEVIRGGEDYFAVTKAFHNALHGAPYEGHPEWFDLFLRVTEENRKWIETSEDIVVIHDPQPVALIPPRGERKGRWIWRCHIDLSHANTHVWDFLRPFVEQYDASLFSSPSFTQGLPIPQYLFYPAMDPLSDKNRDLEPEHIQSVADLFRIDSKL